MIVTLTPNPSVDRTIELTSTLERGAVLRAATVTSQSAGKGVNISRAAVAAGVPTIAVLPAAPTTPTCSSCSATASTAAPSRRPATSG